MPDWRGHDEAKGLRAVAALTEQTQLLTAAMQAGVISVRIAAVERLTDQGALTQVALQSNLVPVRLAAVERISDQRALTQIAKLNQTDLWPAALATQKSAPQWVDQHLAKWHPASQPEILAGMTQKAAAARVTDQQLLAEIAMTDRSQARSEAAERITDQPLLARVFMNSPTALSASVLAQMTDQSLLGDILRSPRGSSGVVQYLNDPKLLADVVIEDNLHHAILFEAVKRITDQDAMRKVAESQSPHAGYAWRHLTADSARQVASALGVPPEQACARMDDHPDAFSEVVTEQQSNDTVEYGTKSWMIQRRVCGLCGKVQQRRSDTGSADTWSKWKDLSPYG